MFSLFAPKEISLFRKALDLLEHRVGSSYSFSRVRHTVETAIKKTPDLYVQGVQTSSSPEVFAAICFANVSGDFIESGELHLYRGILSPAGEEMLKLYTACLDFLVASGNIDAAKRETELAFIRRNISSVG